MFAMTIHQAIHQCPKCELRFSWQTELDDHCRNDHPGFRHEYPAHAAEAPATEKPADTADDRRAGEVSRTSALLATWWGER